MSVAAETRRSWLPMVVIAAAQIMMSSNISALPILIGGIVADLDTAVGELEQRGIDYQRAVQGESTVQIWINDPAGNTIELQQDQATGAVPAG